MTNEVELLAWSHRSKAPIIVAIASDTDVDSSTIRVQMIPRSFWDEDPRFLDAFTAAEYEGIWTRFMDPPFPHHAIQYFSLFVFDEGSHAHGTSATTLLVAPLYCPDRVRRGAMVVPKYPNPPCIGSPQVEIPSKKKPRRLRENEFRVLVTSSWRRVRDKKKVGIISIIVVSRPATSTTIFVDRVE